MYLKATAVTDPAGRYSSIEYDYKMSGAAGGLVMMEMRDNDGEEVAEVSGVTPADQKGLAFKVDCTCKDKAGTSKAGTQYSEVWG